MDPRLMGVIAIIALLVVMVLRSCAPVYYCREGMLTAPSGETFNSARCSPDPNDLLRKEK